MRDRAQIQRLTQEVEQLKHRLAELQQQHHLGLVKYSFLKCLAEGFQVFQEVSQSLGGTGTARHSKQSLVDSQQLQALLAAEDALLQGAGVSSNGGGNGVLGDVGVSTISPAADPMAYFM